MKIFGFQFGFTKTTDLYFDTANQAGNEPWGEEGPHDWGVRIQNTHGHHGIMSFTSIDNAHLFRITIDPSEITEEEVRKWLEESGLHLKDFRTKRA
jgi:hypothetical protein